MRNAILLFALLVPAASAAQTAASAPVPQKHIPAPVLMELRAIENAFDMALLRDCAPERCVSKGCAYVDHVVVDTPRGSSLPGIGQAEGPGSVPAQEYLTQARCDFAHEKSVSTRDVNALVKRLEQRLSKGWLKVTVAHQVLEPISPALAESPQPPPEPPPPPKVEPPAPTPPAPVKWENEVALRELWLSLLPHFFWMIGLFLATIATLLLIWAARRVGKESIEEKAMLAQLAAGNLARPEESKQAQSEPAPEPVAPTPPAIPLDVIEEEAAFVAEQQKLWGERVSKTELAKDDGVVVEMLREWLKAGEFDLLAKAIAIFGDQLSEAFPSDGELAVRKVEFADYMRNLDERHLPSDAQFFRKLNHHAISSSLLAQSDAETYRSLREEFGGTGVARLIESLPQRHGALLFALVPTDLQREVARTVSAELRLQLAGQLLLSNRISREEQGHIFQSLDAARAGRSLPPPPPSGNGIVDRGREIDAPGALSVLLPLIAAEERQALFGSALQRSSGAFPQWYEDIFFPEMLLKVPQELQADMLLDVDIKALAGWYSVQHPAWQESFLGRLGSSMQNAVRANMGFATRAEQLHLARRGHSELVTALKKLAARGKVTFAKIVA